MHYPAYRFSFFWMFILMLLLPLAQMRGQLGCTDPLATNYEEMATDNDGSCIYATQGYMLEELSELPGTLNEISGVVWVNGSLWGLTDSGGDNVLYQVDTLTGAIRKQVVVDMAGNIDWEAMSQSEQYIYVGDVGNNSGDRKNLRIYKIEKQQLLGDTAFAEIIDLQWPDQESFEPQPNATNFDCEAFVVYNDSLHLFSKNWLDQRTRHYVLPTSPGEHTARLVETFNSQGLITAASVNEEGIVVLLGYTDVGTVFLWLLYDFDGTHFFSGNKRRVELGSGLVNGKTEAITFSTDLSGYVAAENFEQSIFRIPPKLFRFDLAPLFELPTAINSPHSEAALQWMAAPNPFDESLRIFHHDYKRSISANTRFYLHDSVGRCVMRGTSSSAEQTWSTQQLGAGFYLLQVVEESGKRYSIRLIKY